MKWRTTIFCLLIATVGTSCASGGTKPGSTRTDARVIDEAAIQKTGFSNVYMVVEALKPLWLRERAATTFGRRATIKVYVDNMLMGGVETLRQIPASGIASIRFLDGMEASNRWGLDHGAGAIVVTSK